MKWWACLLIFMVWWASVVIKEVERADQVWKEEVQEGVRVREAVPEPAPPVPPPEPCGLLMELGADYGPHLIPEFALAVATIRMEADQEPFDGKVAVGIVLRNRTRLKYASDGTLAETILRKLQFSCWNTDHVRRGRVCGSRMDDPLTQEALDAWRESENSRLLTPRVVLYHTDAAPVIRGVRVPWPPAWALVAKFERQIGAHKFYAD